MASTVLQLIGFILGVLSWVGMIVTCASPEWRKNSHGQTLIDNTIRYDGLWVRCKAFATGQTHCDDYNTFFIGLPAVLQVCRALMIASIGIGFIAILVTILGIKCTSIGASNQRAKARIAMIGGLLFGIAAILLGASVSYYAQGVVQEYYNPVLEDDTPMHLRFEYGSALFVGWAVLVIGILAGVIICFTSVFIMMRHNVAARRGISNGGNMTSRSNHHHAHVYYGSQKQQHLPLIQHKNVPSRQVRMQDDATLTKQRVAQHNARLDHQNKHVHHAPAEVSSKKHINDSPNDDSKSSNDRTKRYSAENPRRPHGSELDADFRRHHHHHIRCSKSEQSIAKSRNRDEDRERKREDDEIDGYGRLRPAKEYV